VFSYKLKPDIDSTLGEHIAALDLGSNSFHMVIAKRSHGELRIIEQIGEKVQLAAGLDAQGNISEQAQQRALACLERFNERIKLFNNASVQIVATNALRVAKNKFEFIRLAQSVISFPVEIISGREEARLIYLGVAHTIADDLGRRLVIDIGGGSTELIIGERFESAALESLHMGCVSFRDRYFSNGLLSSESFDQAILHASRELLNIKKHYIALGWNSSIGSSGSVKAILNALVHTGINDGFIDLSSLKQLKDRLIELKHEDRIEELGIKHDRVSIFSAGLSILYACVEVLGIEKMDYAEGALREGLLYDIAGRIRHEDVRERTIVSLQTRYHVDTKQSDLVEATAIHAYRKIARAWGIESIENEQLLRWASRTYEVGSAISHTQYHKHGAYLVKHSDLPGFTNLIKSHLSSLIRLHRRKFSVELFDCASEPERICLAKLCIIFRLAIVLTGSRNTAETDFNIFVSDDGQTVTLDIGEIWISEHPLTSANLKSEQAQLARKGYELRFH